MNRRPPRSPPFPSPPLSRSRAQGRVERDASGRQDRHPVGDGEPTAEAVRGHEERAAGRLERAQVPVEPLSRPLVDRKSTRLNSSHGYISYAVFCLKKQKILT